ncbi:hypothetical protein BD779DRAFT_1476618 [Infundibulicybe gibba]|nr:hypothetical protein BD779DRAFT_1476618 [Infundibulicybe gibba]
MAAPIPVPRRHPAIKLLNDRATDCNSLITHLDRSPVREKIMTFQVPFWSHVILGGLLAWRTIREFITGHLWLRLRWGFRETEIVFRKPTGWRRALLNGLPPEEFERQSTDTILYRAIDPKLVSLNTGYLTRSDYWVLEYGAVGDAYSLVATGEVDIKTWDMNVWTRKEGECNYVGSECRLLEKLKSMGKEDVVEQWKSMRTPGKPVTTQTTSAIVDLFRSQGISLEELWADSMKEVTARATGNIYRELNCRPLSYNTCYKNETTVELELGTRIYYRIDLSPQAGPQPIERDSEHSGGIMRALHYV